MRRVWLRRRKMKSTTGLEPAISRFVGGCPIQLGHVDTISHSTLTSTTHQQHESINILPPTIYFNSSFTPMSSYESFSITSILPIRLVLHKIQTLHILSSDSAVSYHQLLLSDSTSTSTHRYSSRTANQYWRTRDPESVQNHDMLEHVLASRSTMSAHIDSKRNALNPRIQLANTWRLSITKYMVLINLDYEQRLV